MRSTVIGFALGILLLQQQSSLWSWPALILLACLAGFIVIFYCAWGISSQKFRACINSVVYCVVGAIAGWIWASSAAITGLAHRLAPELEGRDLTVIGLITSLPSQIEYGQRFQFSIERVLTENINPVHVPKKVLLNFYTTQFQDRLKGAGSAEMPGILAPGQRWQLNVRLRRPHGLANPYGFDYEAWLLERGVGATGSIRNDARSQIHNHQLASFVWTLNNCIEWVRGRLRQRIAAALPNQPYAPVLIALVIGDQNAISQSDWTVFARTGVSHLIAISGLHITLLSGLAAQILFYLWRRSFFTSYQLPLILPAQKAAALAGALTALIYVALAGFGIPAQRTLIMIMVAAVLCWFDRLTSVSGVLCLALAAVLLIDPWAVMAPGFWLSFFAVGLLFYVSLGRHELHEARSNSLLSMPSTNLTSLKGKLLRSLRQATHAQYVITLGLVPLTLLLFSQISIAGPIANAIAIPVVTFVITPCALLGSVLPDPFGRWPLLFANFVLQQLGTLLTWLSQFHWAVWQGPRPDIWMFLFALLGTAWCLAPRGWPLRWAGLLTWIPICLNNSVYPMAKEFKVTALDVGQGMAILIETAQHRLLYDTGPAYSPESNAGSSVISPYLKARGIDQLDGLLVSHSDTDHSGGALSLMEQYRMRWVMSSLSLESKLVQHAQQTSQHITCIAGQKWEWDDIQFEVLHPPSEIYVDDHGKKAATPNARSCTLKVTNGKDSILLAGDIEASQEKNLVENMPDKLASTVLLAPHHGSGTSSTIPFLQAVDPKIAIFQLGYRNRYRHPKSSVWQRYVDLGIARLRSDQSGAITINFGDEVKVEEYRVTHQRYWYALPDQ